MKTKVLGASGTLYYHGLEVRVLFFAFLLAFGHSSPPMHRAWSANYVTLVDWEAYKHFQIRQVAQ